MRLTRELVLAAPQCINPAQQRMIALRGFKISIIENLGATEDAFECIDLSDNDIIKLDGFTPSKRLSSLIVTNNRISRIGEDIGETLPCLNVLILTNNQIENVKALEPLAKCSKLERISLLNNPVRMTPSYKQFLLKTIPSLKYIDFEKVTNKDRSNALESISSQLKDE